MRSTFGILAVLGFLNIFCQGQDYILDDQGNTGYVFQQQPSTDSSIPFHQIRGFHQGAGIEPAGFYVPSDLQTSDLPHHLQQTLLQYRPQKTSQNDNFQNIISNGALPFRPNDYVKPSTHRPNYSYLLSNRNLPNSFQTSANDLLEFEQSTNDNLDKYVDSTFDAEQNEQKELGSATNAASTSPDNKTLLKTFRPSDSLDLLESNRKHSRHNRQDLETDNNPTEEHEVHTQPNQIRNSEEKSSDKGNQNYIDDEEYDDEYLEEDEDDNKENTDDYDEVDDTQTNNKTFDILTKKPLVTTNDAYTDFVDTDFMDTTTQESASSDINTRSSAMMSDGDMQKEEPVTEVENNPLTEATIKKSITDEKNNFPEYVISVVTSKTIENNTIISPVTITELPTSSSVTADDHKEETSTDSWIVVASVQTSKSISGARYLPSSEVEQHNTNKSLNEPDGGANHVETEDTIESTTPDIITTILKSSTKFKTSTESLIDKLDRVQSDLSSGLLAGGFKNDNIAVIDENTPMKLDTISEVKLTSSSTSPSTTISSRPYPQVNIKKFNAGHRPARPKAKEIIANRSKPISTTTSRPSLEPEISTQEDSKDSASIFKIAKPVDDLSDLLPPNYKPPKPTENNIPKILKNTKIVDDISDLLPPGYSSPKPTSTEGYVASVLAKAKPVEDISALLPPGFKPPTPTYSQRPIANVLAKATPVEDISALLPPGFKPPTASGKPVDNILAKARPVEDISALLPPGFKPPTYSQKPIANILAKATPVEDISALLPPGFKPSTSSENPIANVLAKARPAEDSSALLPPGFKPPTPTSSEKPVANILAKATPVKDISSLLPPGFEEKLEKSNNSEVLEPAEKPKSEQEENKVSKVLTKATPVADISSLLPPGFNLQKQNHVVKSVPNILAKANPVDDISSLLPAGYRVPNFKKGNRATTTTAPPEIKINNTLNNLLPPGYNVGDKKNQSSENLASLTNTSASDVNPNVAAKSKEVKLVFPSRPGGGARKSSRLTTARTPVDTEMSKASSPTIQKGWPVRSSTEFTGWPTPSTTPISIEKLLEAARAAATSTSTASPTTASPTTTTTKPTTTTPRPTTPGICVGDCDLVGTIKLVGGVKWVPELLDRNTKEYQILANDVEDELEALYSSSPLLKNWYRKIRIDGFSEGSVLVDYLVELSEIGKKVDTQEIKHLFHESLSELTANNSNREGKSLNDTKSTSKVSLGNFELDPKYTDFVVIPKQSIHTVSYADDNILLPQWAIAVIVIGLASLLFVIIFGVTVLVNRHKNAKKTPAPLTEDMLNELNKNHMGGLENFGGEDFYNLDDVWSDKPYEHKPHKKRTNDSIYDNSMSNLYDSWRSQWDGPYDNRYDGSIHNSQHTGYNGSRRPKYDTDF